MRTVDPVRHEARRRHIVEAAAVCFARKGFEKTTTAEIRTAAGISTGSLFHYFPSKRAIFRAVFELDGEETARKIAEAGNAADPWAAILDLVDFLTAPLADPAVAGLAVEAVAQAGRDPEFAALITRNDHALREGLAGLLRRAAAQHRIDQDLDPATAATWIVTLVDALYSRASMDPDFTLSGQLPILRLVLTRFLQGR
ncbi:TetR/AcrR family transcriptional regulator [Amycolatopsis anabasis]|uniref:TetR/AcrR family transcriptional regulator n=1 Tax=Amycolatopsis anabasis TaxID=1840409 RepID=UPI00131B6A87|nr:TetR/AcrR family transcriptional regulator [Amycolatopsis anabasis]